METIVTCRQFGKEWHFGSDTPTPGREVYALIDEDCSTASEPELVEAVCEWREGHNPPFLWGIFTDNDEKDTTIIAGGYSVYAWRYK